MANPQIDGAAIQRVTLTDLTGAAVVAPAQYKPYQTVAFTKPDVTVAGSSGAWTTANSPITLFTITGTVFVRPYGVVTTLFASTGATGTLALGSALNVAKIIAATTANGSQFILNSVWITNTPNELMIPLSAAAGIEGWILTNATNIILTIATNNMTAGGMTLYCDWIPVSAGSTVVAATP